MTGGSKDQMDSHLILRNLASGFKSPNEFTTYLKKPGERVQKFKCFRQNTKIISSFDNAISQKLI